MGIVLNDTPTYRVFRVFNAVFLILLAILCIVPMLNVLAMSFSDNIAIQMGKVIVWPVNVTLDNYEMLIGSLKFWRALWRTVQRLFLGTIVNMVIIVLTAYPLSKPDTHFPSRRKYVWYYLVTMLFSGGLIPTFMVVRYTGLLNTIWALIIPVVMVYNIILMLNFFRQIPRELEEAAFMDGAGHLTILGRIYLPTSLPALATIGLFVMVFHWNEWFMPIIYLQKTDLYPLQSYLRQIILSAQFEVNTYEDFQTMQSLSFRGIVSAQIFLAMLPILLVYPFLQKFFAKGIVLGSVKG